MSSYFFFFFLIWQILHDPETDSTVSLSIFISKILRFSTNIYIYNNTRLIGENVQKLAQKKVT